MEDLKTKIISALQTDFIGDVIFNDDEIEQMKQDCRTFYKRAQASWSKIYNQDDISELMVLIINIAKNWDDESEGRFWTKLFGEIFDDGSISPTKFYSEFEYCINNHGKKLFHSRENKRMFREVFLLHALAPDNSGSSFISLLWNWYTDSDVIDFDYQPDDSIYNQMANFLEHEFGGESDFEEALSFEGKTYAIKSSFKYLFTQDKESGLKLLHKIYSAFDDIYFRGTYDNNSYIDSYCNAVVDKLLSETKGEKSKRNRKEHNHIVSDYSRIYATYEILEDKNISIVIPEIRAIGESADEYRIDVFNNDSLILSLDDYIVGTRLKRRIKKTMIPFSLFDKKINDNLNLRVVLQLYKDGDYVLIYDSKCSLYRDFIVFKSSRENRSQTCKPGAYFIAHPYNVYLNKISSLECNDINGYVSTVNAVENDYISTENQNVFFNQQPQNTHVIVVGNKVDNVEFVKDEIDCSIYKNLSYIDVLLDKNTPIESIIVTIDNNKHYPLISNSQQIENGRRINLKNLEANNQGFHCLLISDISKRKLLHRIDYYIIERVTVNIGEGFVFDKKNININISQLSNNGIFLPIVDAVSRAGQETISAKFDSGELVVPLPYIRWRIDDGDWNYGSLRKDYWHNNDFLHNNCTIEVENHSEFNCDLAINDMPIKRRKNNIFLLGDALTENKKNDFNTITLTIGKDKFALFRVYNKEELTDFDIDIDDKIIDMSPYFIGEINAKFIVKLKNEMNCYEFDSELKSAFEPDIVDGEYDVTISILDFWGNSIVLYQDCCIIGNPDKFCFDNKKVVLKSFKKNEGGKVKLENSSIVELKYLREEKLGTVYSGVLIDKKKKYNVEIYKKDENSLTFYFVDGDNLLSVNYNLKKNEFTMEGIKDGDTTIIPCSSCYYNSVEVA